MPAAGAHIAMSAEGGGATMGDGQQYFLVLPGHPLATTLEKRLPRGANQVGHLQERPTHLGLTRGLAFLLLNGQRQGVQRTGRSAEMALGKVQVDSGLFQIVMP